MRLTGWHICQGL